MIWIEDNLVFALQIENRIHEYFQPDNYLPRLVILTFNLIILVSIANRQEVYYVR
jgi:hypothetical protein